MVLPLILIGALTLGTLIGWFLHWAMHQRWAGKFNKAHLTHHAVKYPPRDLMSDTYRIAGKDDGLLIFVPVIAAVLIPMAIPLYLLGISTVLELLVAFVLLSLVGVAHEVIHTAFHLKTTWFNRFGWFQVLRARHFLHHRYVKLNLGIVFYGWDRVFRTWRRP